ncbi:MFS transporter [Shouchella clausii]|uniref:MDR family MFS transporter n=1 Tax=Shouchella tritolerans TaxID=2979466 RepID=UPI000786D05B|nr:MFS transporter [Shouchella tritolerans]GIN12393.1 MFS transporter [Shouchella clausii]
MSSFRELHVNIKVRIIHNFISRFVGSMILPFMAIYLSVHFGATLAGVLLLFSVVVGFLVSLISGYFSDYYGRRKIIVASEGIRFLSFVVMAICNSPLITAPLITFIMMLVNTLCTGLSIPANDAMLIDVSTKKQRKFMYTIIYWSGNLSVAIGGVLGAFLFSNYLFQLFVVLSILSFLITLLVGLFIKESYTPNNERIAARKHIVGLLKNYNFVVKDKTFILFMIASVLIFSAEFHLVNYISIRLAESMPIHEVLGWDINGVQAIGILKSENTLLVLILMLFVNKLVFKFNNKKVLLLSALVFATSYSLMPITDSLYVLMLLMFVATIGEVLFGPLEQTYFASMAPDEHRSSYMAFNALKGDLALLIASLTVIIGSILPPIVIAIIIFLTGLTAVLLYNMVISSSVED